MAIDSLEVELVKFIPRAGHQIRLGPTATNKDDLCAVSAQRVGDHERWHYVAGGPAGCDQIGRLHSRPQIVAY